MKVAVSVFLLLLCSVSTTSQVDLQSQMHESSPQDINAVLREMTASLAQLKERMTHLQKVNQVYAAKLKKLEKQEIVVKRQQTDIDVLKTNLKVRQVAFSASLLTDGHAIIGGFKEHTTLIFKHVVTNIGGAYNPNTGIFTAPVRGVYHFEWHMNLSGPAGTSGVLVKNTNHVFTAYEYQSHGSGSATQSVSLLLEVGDVIFVRLWKHSKTFDNQNHPTTFSGHLLFPM